MLNAPTRTFSHYVLERSTAPQWGRFREASQRFEQSFSLRAE